MVIDRFFHGNFHRIQLQLGKFSMKMETRLETSWDARPSPSQATSYTLQDKLIIFGYHLYGNPPNFDQGKYHRIGSIGIVLSLETMVCTIKKRAFRLKFAHHPILWKQRSKNPPDGLARKVWISPRKPSRSQAGKGGVDHKKTWRYRINYNQV